MLKLRWRRFWPIRVKSTDYSRGFQVGYDEGFHEADRIYAANWAIYRQQEARRFHAKMEEMRVTVTDEVLTRLFSGDTQRIEFPSQES